MALVVYQYGNFQGWIRKSYMYQGILKYFYVGKGLITNTNCLVKMILENILDHTEKSVSMPLPNAAHPHSDIL